jgi:hypothetical protein
VRIEAENDAFERDAEAAARQAPVQNLDTTNLDKWKQRNADWYGIERDMTAYSLEVDKNIRAAGAFTVGTPEYSEAVD